MIICLGPSRDHRGGLGVPCFQRSSLSMFVDSFNVASSRTRSIRADFSVKRAVFANNLAVQVVRPIKIYRGDRYTR